MDDVENDGLIILLENFLEAFDEVSKQKNYKMFKIIINPFMHVEKLGYRSGHFSTLCLKRLNW